MSMMLIMLWRPSERRIRVGIAFERDERKEGRTVWEVEVRDVLGLKSAILLSRSYMQYCSRANYNTGTRVTGRAHSISEEAFLREKKNLESLCASIVE